MKKILFLIGSLEGGGAEKVLVDTVNNMPSEEFCITLQTIFDKGIHKSELNKNIKYKSIVNAENPLLKKSILKLALHFFPAKYLYEKYVKSDYDYEIAFLEGLPTKIISNSETISKKYAWVHINFENNFDSLSYYKDINECKKCYKKFDRIICVSEAVKEGFEKQVGCEYPVSVLYNVLDEKSIINKSHSSTKIYSDSKGLNIISVGRLENQKGYDRLIRIAEKLKKLDCQFKIYIVGEGKERKNLQLLINELKNNDVVELIGYKDNPYPYILNADLFVCSSREEGFSTVVTESLILGVPVITTACAGMKEIFGEFKCGKIVDNSEVALLEELYSILCSPEKLKIYKKEAELRGKQFRIEQRMKEFLKLF